ncbi:hypothetical protein TNIN_488771 [Trichonephila inaurata madagascariensis]|uniref:Uncharacterized protein n=1 Tax=Trichonephila inaurata madagascariensis TaxID=2747483 RepID=A0A8X6WY26_9ARAC|nr:hypothetical protein TNIN_488771 [Trichonephila inaurata madagascariensis]
MASDPHFKHFVRHLFPYFYVKYQKLEAADCVEPFVAKGHLTENLFDVITKAMFELQDMLIASWIENFDRERQLMTSSAEKYISQTILFCHAQQLVIRDIYERFIVVCALTTIIGMYAYRATGKKFYKLTPVILTVLFEGVLREDFKKRGGWKRFERYIMQQDYVEYYETYSAFQTCKEQKKDIHEDIKQKMRAFESRRKHFYVPFGIIEEGIENVHIVELTHEAVKILDTSLIAELNSIIVSEMPSTSSLQETSISRSSSELTIKEATTTEFNQSSKASEDVGSDES